MRIVRVVPSRVDEWPADMRRVRDSAFNHEPLKWVDRVSRRRRYLAERGRYPHQLINRDCWIVRAEDERGLVGYAWGYSMTEARWWAYIDDVAVHAEHQGMGVGTMLIDDMVAWLGGCGVEYITGYPIDGRMAKIFGHHGITSGLPPSRDVREDADVDS